MSVSWFDWFACFSDEIQDDEDVIAESGKILSSLEEAVARENQVLIAGLSKYFSRHKAVDNLYLSIPKGECFGLLGL